MWSRAVRPDAPTPARIVIVDDEPIARRSLRLALAGMAGVQIAGEARGAAEAVRVIAEVDPDVVLLDVRMPDGDGFDVIRHLPAECTPAIVMVTAFDQHAIRAFEHRAIDYVLKPFTDARLRDAVTRAIEFRAALDAAGRERALASTLEALVVQSRDSTRYARRILVKHREASSFVPVDDIDWLEATGNYVTLHTGRRTHLIRGPLTAVLATLDPDEFVRIHRSRAVQVRRVAEVRPCVTGDFIAVLHDGQRLRVSRTFRRAFLR